MPKLRTDRLPPTWDVRCGTDAGAKAHERRGENVCANCRRSRATTQRNRRQKRGLRTGLQNCVNCGIFMNAIDYGTVRCSRCGRVDHV